MKRDNTTIGAGELNAVVSASIQESQLASGEIAIDPQGLIHHSKDEDEAEASSTPPVKAG